MVRGHLSPRFLDLKTYRMWGVIGRLGSRDNVVPGPAVALDGPVNRLKWSYQGVPAGRPCRWEDERWRDFITQPGARLPGWVGGATAPGGAFDPGQFTVSVFHLWPLVTLLRRWQYVMVRQHMALMGQHGAVGHKLLFLLTPRLA